MDGLSRSHTLTTVHKVEQGAVQQSNIQRPYHELRFNKAALIDYSPKTFSYTRQIREKVTRGCGLPHTVAIVPPSHSLSGRASPGLLLRLWLWLCLGSLSHCLTGRTWCCLSCSLLEALGVTAHHGHTYKFIEGIKQAATSAHIPTSTSTNVRRHTPYNSWQGTDDLSDPPLCHRACSLGHW